jgi:nucleoside-diphosphate-sugar epimerase
MQVLITGAAGQLGRMLSAAWADTAQMGFEPIWSVRRQDGSDGFAWDILSGPAPDIAPGAVILHLAGILRGDAAALSANKAMALDVCAAAKSAGARHVFLASSASVYGSSFQDHAEVQLPVPRSDYGRAKLAMERAALCWAHDAGPIAPGVTCLRIGNVLGADALFGHGRAGRSIALDPVPGQPRGPQRSYIGPAALAKVLADLIGQTLAGQIMPPILNVAAPGALFMADLLDAANAPFNFGPAIEGIIPKVSLATTKLSRMVAVGAADAVAMVADWRRLSAAVS